MDHRSAASNITVATAPSGPTTPSETAARKPRVPKRALACGGFVAATFCAGLTALAAPQAAANKATQRLPNDWPLSIANVLPSGQPVIPIFESWYPNPDGTHAFSFGFISLNSEEAVHIPPGPDDFIEPKRFDGFQPTYFEVAPKEPTSA